MNVAAYKERLEGYRKALSDAGMAPDEKIIYYDSIVRETGHESGMKAIEAGCDAIYSAGDFSALGAMDAAAETGKSVPDDFGVVGTANENFTALMSPSMSSLELNPYEMGRQAAQAFLSGTEDIIKIRTNLMIRQSSQRTNK
jgi:LacI family transcriptional regulator